MIILITSAGSLTFGYFIIRFLLKRQISVKRISFRSVQDLKDNQNHPVVLTERYLRKTAFEQVAMDRPDSFYTDEEMNAPFDFIVLYNKRSKTPLLSSRSYTDQALIRKQLKGHETGDYLNFSLLSDENYVLLDRLSANSTSNTFTKMRQRAFMNYYIQVLKSYPKHHIILMARSSPDERLLTKYLRLGFHVIGKQKHNQVDHWIVLLSAKNRTRGLAQSTKQYFLFKLFA